jgi:hypothetical protein
MRADFLWKHALMLRLEVVGAASPTDVAAEDEGQIPPDLLPLFIPNKLLPGRVFEREL